MARVALMFFPIKLMHLKEWHVSLTLEANKLHIFAYSMERIST